MPTIHAILTLLDDTILSAHSKTVEVAQSLTYIPGRVLLGAVASRLYAKLSQEEQFSYFTLRVFGLWMLDPWCLRTVK